MHYIININNMYIPSWLEVATSCTSSNDYSYCELYKLFHPITQVQEVSIKFKKDMNKVHKVWTSQQWPRITSYRIWRHIYKCCLPFWDTEWRIACTGRRIRAHCACRRRWTWARTRWGGPRCRRPPDFEEGTWPRGSDGRGRGRRSTARWRWCRTDTATRWTRCCRRNRSWNKGRWASTSTWRHPTTMMSSPVQTPRLKNFRIFGNPVALYTQRSLLGGPLFEGTCLGGEGVCPDTHI